jgi:hypothetical protein
VNVRRTRFPRQPGAAALASIAAGALLAVTACSSRAMDSHSAPQPGAAATTRPSASGKAAQPALCLGKSELTTVTLRGTTALHAAEPGQVLRGVTLTARPLVRDLAGAVCRLSLAPRTTVTCPPQLGGGLQLAFAANGRRFPPVTVMTRGCRVVKGLGPLRAPDPQLWRTLSKALGFRLPAASPGQSGGGVNP